MMHLWPTIARINLEKAKELFLKGDKFLTCTNQVVRIKDLPMGTPVLIHCEDKIFMIQKPIIN